jgi:hypothetical protein
VHFRVARTVSSTRYIIFGTDFVENLTCRASPAAGDILKSLPDALGRAGLGREIEKLLIGFGVLHHSTTFPLTVKTSGRLVLGTCCGLRFAK